MMKGSIYYLAAMALLCSPTTVMAMDKNKKQGVLEHWNNVVNVVGGGFIIEGGKRFVREGIEGTSAFYLKPVSDMNDDSDDRRLQIKQSGAVTTSVPFPEDGAVLYQANTLVFAEDSETIPVDCFIFDHTPDDNAAEEKDFAICDGVMVDEENGVATLKAGFFETGSWTWYVNGTDGTSTSPQTFTMRLAEEEEDNNDEATLTSGAVDESRDASDVADEEWPHAGAVERASGRIYYSIGTRHFACSGTVMNDAKSGRSLILTAAHCVWDDIARQFGENAIFIPDRTSNLATNEAKRANIHQSCADDVCGCWTLSAGFVHQEWKDYLFPANLPWDYGVWVVDDVGSHTGNDCGSSEALDEAVEEFTFTLGMDLEGETVYGMGYALEHNPDFHYCVDEMTTETLDKHPDVTTWWIPACSLNGGSSGGPFVANMNLEDGTGVIVTVGSWSYGDSTGNGGPIIDASAARCLVNAARTADFEAIEGQDEGEEGVFVSCHDRPCITPEEADEYSTRRALKLRGSSASMGDGDVDPDDITQFFHGRVLCANANHHGVHD